MPRVVYTAGFLTEANKTNISPQVVGMVELSNNAFAPGSVIGHTTYPLPAPYNYGGRLRDVSSLDFSLNGGVGRVTFAISNADLAEVPNVANDNYIGWECKVHKVLILDNGTVTGILLLHGVVTSYTMTDQVVDMDVTTRINVTNSINNRRVGKKCPWVFKGTECGYNGVLTDCNKIYGSNDGCLGRSNQHRFGGFPERESVATIGVVSGLGPTPGYILAETFSEQVVTANTTVTATDLRYLKCDHTGPITITLPNPSTFPNNGQPITIKDCSTPGATTNNITVNAAGGGTVNGSTLVITNSNGAVTLSADKINGDWRIVADYNSSNVGGSVTSVAMTVPSILTVTGSPITSSGTLAISLSTQPANTFLAGPVLGSDDIPTFRQITLSDLGSTTGSGSFVLQTTPTIITPRIAEIRTASTPFRAALGLAQAANSANYFQITNAATGAGLGPILEAVGTGTDVNLHLKSKGAGEVVVTSSGLSVKSITTSNPGVISVLAGSGLSSGGQIRLYSDSGNKTGLVAPDSLAASVYYTLPSADGASGQVLSTNGAGILSWTTVSTGGAGTVTSVALTAPSSILSVSGSPVTTNGTLDIALVAQGANQVFAGPSSGVTPLAPTFRSLVFEDLPLIPTNRLLGRASSGTGVIEAITPASGILTWLQTPTSANLAAAVLDTTGSGSLTFATSPFFSTSVTLANNAEIRFAEQVGNGTNYVGFKAPALIGSNQIWTLPASDGTSNQALVTNGSGVITWATLTGNETITLSGNVTGSGTTSITTTIANNAVTNAMLAGSIQASKLVGTDIATVGTITTGTWQGSVIGSAYGGAGSVNGILKANGSGTVSAAIAGTDYEVPLTFSTGLTRSTNTITVNTTQNIIRLSNLTTNGFVKTSGSNGTLSVDTNIYLTGNQTITLSGDVTGSGTTSISTTIANNAVTLAKFQQIATNSILGRAADSTGNVEQLTALPFAYTGDVTRPADSNTTTIANDAVTYAKMQNVSNGNRLLGRITGAGDVEEIAAATGILTWLQTPSSANLAAAVTDETGSGSLVFGTSPSFTTSATFVNNAEIRFAEQTGNGTNYVGFKAPISIGSDLIWTLPSGDGSANQVLSTNGSGVLSWTTVSAGVSDGDKGDIVVSSLGSVWTIDSKAVTFAKFQDINGNRILGRISGSGSMEEIAPASGILTWIQNASSANLRAAVTDETGTGVLVFATSPGFTTSITLLDTAEVRFAESAANGTNYVGFRAAPSLSSNTIWRLPTGDGLANQVLSTNGTGVLSWISPTATVADGSYGDITVSGGGVLWTINFGSQLPNRFFVGPTTGFAQPPTWRTMVTADIQDDIVTFAKVQNISSSRILGRTTASSGDIEELIVGTGLTLANGQLRGGREVLTGNRTYYVGFLPGTAGTGGCTITNATPAVVNCTGSNLVADDPVVFSTTVALPSPLVAGQVYYVIAAGLTADSFRIATAPGGSAINTTSAGSGLHTVRTGKDTNTGIGTNSRTVALLTVQRAIDIVSSEIDVGGYVVTIEGVNGLYSESVFLNTWVGGGRVQLELNGGQIAGINIIGVLSGVFLIKGLKLRSVDNTGNLLNHTGVGTVLIGDNVIFGKTNTGNQINVASGGAYVKPNVIRLGSFTLGNAFGSSSSVRPDPIGGSQQTLNTAIVVGGHGLVINDPVTFIGSKTATSFTVSGSTITSAGHTFANGDQIAFSTAGQPTLPSPLVIGTRYFVVNVSGSTFQVSNTSGGSAITLTTSTMTGVRAFAGVPPSSGGTPLNVLQTYYVQNATPDEFAIATTKNAASPLSLSGGSDINIVFGTNRYTISGHAVNHIATNGSGAIARHVDQPNLPPVCVIDNSDMPSSISNSISAVDTATDTITINSHGLQNGDAVVFSTSPAPPTGVAANTLYYVYDVTTNTFTLRASATNRNASAAKVDITGNGTGATCSPRYANTTRFANATYLSFIYSQAVFSLGTVTAAGARYQVAGNSVIGVHGANANHFPGDAAGTTADGGIYMS